MAAVANISAMLAGPMANVQVPVRGVEGRAWRPSLVHFEARGGGTHKLSASCAVRDVRDATLSMWGAWWTDIVERGVRVPKWEQDQVVPVLTWHCLAKECRC
jgi:hypothetical protein